MRSLLLLVACLLAVQARADDMGLTGVGSRAATPYIGPSDAYAGATDVWSCVRPNTLAYARSGGNGCAFRAATGTNAGSTMTFVMLPAGFIDVSSANAWAGTDVTSISCTSSGTTLTCTGASSTPNTGDTFTGPGLTQPCFAKSVGTFVAGAGTVTTGGAGCGTVGSAAVLTAQGALYAQEAYDQAGSFSLVENTSTEQPEWLPNCVNARPCLYSPPSVSAQLITQSNYTPPGASSISISTVGQRVTGTASADFGLVTGTNSLQVGGGSGLWESIANTGSTSKTGITEAAWHAAFSSFGASSAFLNIDGVNTTGTASNSAAAGSIRMNYNGSTSAIYEAELLLYGTAVSLSNSALVCANQVVFYGTPTGANCP